MKTKKIYSDNENETCYTLEVWTKRMLENTDIEKLVLYEMQPMKGSGMFYCTEFDSIGDSSEKTCGKECSLYEPRNGKSGYCKNSRRPYETADNENTITLINPNYVEPVSLEQYLLTNPEMV